MTTFFEGFLALEVGAVFLAGAEINFLATVFLAVDFFATTFLVTFTALFATGFGVSNLIFTSGEAAFVGTVFFAIFFLIVI